MSSWRQSDSFDCAAERQPIKQEDERDVVKQGFAVILRMLSDVSRFDSRSDLRISSKDVVNARQDFESCYFIETVRCLKLFISLLDFLFDKFLVFHFCQSQ